MQRFIEARRDIEQPPGKELKDYEEYSHLYALAWSDPLNRWLLSTLPSSMIFDDHDVRDDWNTSYAWKQEIEKTSWWHERIVSGLASYWVYQHLGNLSPEERAEDDIWQRVAAAPGRRDELDLTERARRPRRAGRPEARRPTGGATPRLRRRPARGRRLAGRAGARAGPPRPARRRRAGLAGRADARRREAPAHRHVAAVPAAARPALPGGVERGGRQRARGASGPRRSARGSGRPSTSSTGAPSRRASSRSRRWPSRSRTASAARRRRP